jgi:hypothetical protein
MNCAECGHPCHHDAPRGNPDGGFQWCLDGMDRGEEPCGCPWCKCSKPKTESIDSNKGETK